MKRSRRKHLYLHIVLYAATAGAFVAGAASLWAATLSLPDFSSFEERKVSESTKIYDRTGEILLYDVHADIRRSVVPFDEISLHIKNATVAIEDSEFYGHFGLKPTAIVRAFFANLAAGEIEQGGSTITQQVIKNTLLTNERKLTRKIKEAVLSVKLEQTHTKDEILELYLNEVPYGGNLYGVEEAALSYFGKNAEDINLAEAAYLAALPQAPTYYLHNEERLEERKNIVLFRMEELGFITAEQMKEAQSESVAVRPPEERGIKAPHFVLYTRAYAEEELGIEDLETAGLTITTTLDWELQKQAEDVVKEYGEKNARNFNAHNAALVAIDPDTGQIRAMAGSRDWFSSPYPEGCTPGATCLFDPKVNVATSKQGRQPGSSFKPFVYATAFKKGYTPETIVFDLKTEFSTSCTPDGVLRAGEDVGSCYSPKNYDNTFRGPITFRNALARSINVPAVKALYLADLSDSLKTARDLGITTLGDPNRYGLTLVLGGGEVRLLEMTSAYSVFANDGLRNEPVSILSVTDRSGATLMEYKKEETRAIDANIARTVSDILSDNEARAPAFGAHSPLVIDGRNVAAKTGTTNNYRDAWIIGYSPSLAVGAWAGNSNNEPMEKRVAGFVVAPLWNEFMTGALAGLPVRHFVPPERENGYEDLKPVLRGNWRGSRRYVIDTVSGKLATELTPEETQEERVQNEIHNILYWIDKDDPRGPIPENPESDPQFVRWEVAVNRFAAERGLAGDPEEEIPTEYDDVHTKENLPELEINAPRESESFGKTERITVRFDLRGSYPLLQTDVFVDEAFAGSIPAGGDREFSFTPGELALDPGTHTLRARAYDEVYNRTEQTVTFVVEPG